MEKTVEEIVAHNLTELRKSRKWTQAELAERIHYSDKSVSKWERGDALPDLKVLVQLSELFGVTLDFFVTENAMEERQEFQSPAKGELGYRIGVELLAVAIVWLVATAVCTYTAISSGKVYWLAFIWAVPASALILTLFSDRWHFTICALIFRSVFCWTILAAIYLQLLRYNMWMIFLIGIPAQAAIILWAQIRHSAHSRRES